MRTHHLRIKISYNPITDEWLHRFYIYKKEYRETTGMSQVENRFITGDPSSYYREP